MVLQLPRKWSPRVFAVYLTVTIVGGVILVLFLVLIGLFYWMNARRPLPAPARMVHPDASAWVVLTFGDASPEARGVQAATFVNDRAPAQIRNLLDKGLGDPKCPVQVVNSVVGSGPQSSPALAVSIGRYPGLFYLVRRDIERRAVKGSAPFSLSYHQGKIILRDSDAGAGAMSLVDTSFLAADTPDDLKPILDRMVGNVFSGGPAAAPAGMEPPPGALAGVQAWVHRWADAQPCLLPALRARQPWQQLRAQIAQGLPAIERTDDFRAAGELFSGDRLRLRLSFHAGSKEEAASLAAAVSRWFQEKGSPLGIRIEKAKSEETSVSMELTAGFTEK